MKNSSGVQSNGFEAFVIKQEDKIENITISFANNGYILVVSGKKDQLFYNDKIVATSIDDLKEKLEELLK